MIEPRIVIIGGGFAGTYTALELERRWQCHPQTKLTLVSPENFYLMTPLLFEAASGEVEARHAVNPIRPLLRHAQFIEGIVYYVDFAHRVAYARNRTGEMIHELPYDQLVVAVGGRPAYDRVVGSEHAMPFKSIADAILLRNHVLDAFERAAVEPDPRRRRHLLRFIVIGGGLVGVELMGELSDFARGALTTYKQLSADELSFHLLEAMPQILPELSPSLARYAERTLQKKGVEVRTGTPVVQIAPEQVFLPGDVVLTAHTVLFAAGLSANPLLEDFPLAKDRRGRILTDETMRSTTRPDVWALGDCAAIPDANGKPYPPLAQHALREATTLGRNLSSVLRGREPAPFVYFTRGTLALLGRRTGVGKVLGLTVRGTLAWLIWRGYYLFQMPRWDRRLRVLLDWMIAAVFPIDTAKLVFHVPPTALRAEIPAHPEQRTAEPGVAGHETV